MFSLFEERIHEENAQKAWWQKKTLSWIHNLIATVVQKSGVSVTFASLIEILRRLEEPYYA